MGYAHRILLSGFFLAALLQLAATVPALSQTTERVSVGSFGVQANRFSPHTPFGGFRV